jgi:outer membrane protein assembly factor BamB
MKRRAWLLVLLLMLCLSVPARAESSSEIHVKVNGAAITFPVDPRNIEGRVLVPMREIFEALGSTLDWNGTTQSVHATAASGLQVDLHIGSRVAQADGQLLVLDVPPRLIDGRTLVPVRFVAEALGAAVTWEEPTQTVVITAGAPSGAALHTGAPSSREELLERALPATVMMNEASVQGAEWVASGFFLNSKGLVVTNYHVLNEALGPEIMTHDGKRYNVTKVVAANKAADVAVVETEAVGYAALPLSLQENATPGEGVLAIGNPLGEQWSVTEGSVSSGDRMVEGRPYVEHTAPLNKGNSGGPLIATRSGRVLGMNTFMATDGAGQSHYFAVPGATIAAVLDGTLPRDRLQVYLPSPTTPNYPGGSMEFPPTAVAGEWPHYMGGPSNRAYSTVSPGLQLKPSWQYDYTTYRPGLVLAHGILFATDSLSSGAIHAFDPATGKELWKQELGSVATPPVSGELGFYLIADGWLMLFKEDGTRVWKQQTHGAEQLLLSDGKLLVAGNGVASAFDPVTGKELWSTTFSKDPHSPKARIAAADGKLVVPESSDITHVLETKTGQILYTLTQEYTSDDVAPVIDAGLLYLTSGQDISAYNLNTGKRLWRISVGELILAKPSIGQGILVVEGGDVLMGAGQTFGYDARTGTKLWAQDRKSRPGGATILGDYIYAGGNGMVVRKLATGEVVNTLLPETQVSGFVVGTADALFIPNAQWGLYALQRDPAVPAPGPTKDWSAATPPPPVPAPPVAKGEWLYVLGDPGNRAYAATGPGLDLEDRWGSMFARGGRLLFTQGTLFVVTTDDKGTVYAVDPFTGETLWQQQVDGRATNPVAGPKGIYVAANGRVTLFNAEGTRVWQKEVGGNYPLLVDGKLLVAGGEKVKALDPDTGNELWSTPVAFDWDRRQDTARLAAGSGRVVVADQKATHVLDLATGKELYTIQGFIDAPIIDGTLLYLGTQSTVYAFDLATGKQVWGTDVAANHSVLAVGNGILVLTTWGGTTYGYNARTGAQVWSVKLPIVDNATIIGEDLYTGSERGLNVWKLATGEKVTTFLPYSMTLGSVVPTADALYVTSAQGGLYALQKKQ